jgi:hypothetical protein
MSGEVHASIRPDNALANRNNDTSNADKARSREGGMQKSIGLAIVTIFAGTGTVRAQVPLSTYADSKGYINVQELTCGQLANTYQEDADYLTAWYSGWYNGLAKKHFADIPRAKEGEHLVIVYCKAHPEKKVVHAIGVMLKEEKD